MAATENTDKTNLESSLTETSGTAPSSQQIDVAITNENDKISITSNVKVEPFANVETNDAVTIATSENSDPVLDTVDLETNRTEVINSSAENDDIVKKTDETCVNKLNESSIELSSLDAALDDLNDNVRSLIEEQDAKQNDHSPEAKLDEALATLNTEVLDLLKESRKIQDELQSSSSSKGAVHKDSNKYFDYSLYRESSISPPPHPPITYRWEDIRRDKEKVRFHLNFTLTLEIKMFFFFLVVLGWLSLDIFRSTRAC